MLIDLQRHVLEIFSLVSDFLFQVVLLTHSSTFCASKKMKLAKKNTRQTEIKPILVQKVCVGTLGPTHQGLKTTKPNSSQRQGWRNDRFRHGAPKSRSSDPGAMEGQGRHSKILTATSLPVFMKKKVILTCYANFGHQTYRILQRESNMTW
jgi:hypothetical protein